MDPDLPARILAMCKARGWRLDWCARGAYLHLEASELIEAIRGKRGVPMHEAADVLLVLMSITEANGVPWADVVAHAEQRVVALTDDLEPYPGEHCDPPDGQMDRVAPSPAAVCRALAEWEEYYGPPRRGGLAYESERRLIRASLDGRGPEGGVHLPCKVNEK